MHGYWGGGCCVFPSIRVLSRTTKDAIKFRHNRNFLERSGALPPLAMDSNVIHPVRSKKAVTYFH